MHTVGFEDSQNLVTCATSQYFEDVGLMQSFHTSNDLDLGDTMAITEDNTNLRGSCALSGEFADVLLDGLGGALEPRGHCARIWDGRSADTLSFAVKTTHGSGSEWLSGSVWVVDEALQSSKRKLLNIHTHGRRLCAKRENLGI